MCLVHAPNPWQACAPKSRVRWGPQPSSSRGLIGGLREHSPLSPTTSSPSGGRSINVTGQGFSLIQTFSMVVIAEPLESWQQRQEAGPLQPRTVSLLAGELCGALGPVPSGLTSGLNLQVVGTEYVFHNDSLVVFSSPAVPEEPEAYNLTALIQMDGHRALLRTEAGAFEYVADPTFKNFTGGIKKQVNKLIHAQVRTGRM